MSRYDSRRKENIGEPKNSPSPQCWLCVYQQKGGITLLGFCLYFLHLNQKKKEIPPEIVDKGCRYYFYKENSHPLFIQTLKEFNDTSKDTSQLGLNLSSNRRNMELESSKNKSK